MTLLKNIFIGYAFTVTLLDSSFWLSPSAVLDCENIASWWVGGPGIGNTQMMIPSPPKEWEWEAKTIISLETGKTAFD